MNPLINMILASLFSGMGGGLGNNSNQMNGINPNMNNMFNGNALLNMLMGAMGGGNMNPGIGGNPLMNMLMGGMGNNRTPFNNGHGNNANMNGSNNMHSNNTNMGGFNPNMGDINSLLSMFMGNQGNGNMNNMTPDSSHRRRSHSKK